MLISGITLYRSVRTLDPISKPACTDEFRAYISCVTVFVHDAAKSWLNPRGYQNL